MAISLAERSATPPIGMPPDMIIVRDQFSEEHLRASLFDCLQLFALRLIKVKASHRRSPSQALVAALQDFRFTKSLAAMILSLAKVINQVVRIFRRLTTRLDFMEEIMLAYQRRAWISLGLVMLLVENSCTAASVRTIQKHPVMIGQEASESIGTATQDADGTLVLSLRATGAAGASGDAVVRYPPSHPNYGAVKKHVGPIPKNESVEVKPFP